MPAYNKKKSFIRAILCALHIAAFGLISLSASLSNAQSEIEAEPKQYVKIRLLAEKSQIAAGEEIWIGIEQSIAPHWHTYWQNPGDSGSSAKVDWDLPEGFNIGEIIWPTPKKIPYGPLANYGYENNVVLLQKLKAPHTLPEGPIALSADIELLVCKEICIPEFGTYELTLNDPSALDEDNAAFFEVAHAQLPQVMDWDASYTEHENMFNLRLHIQDQDLLARMEGQDIALYPLNWGILNNPADNTATVNIEDQTLIISQPRGDRALAAIDSFRSVIDFTSQDGARHSYRFTAAQEGSLVASNDAAETQSDAVSEEAYTNTNTKNAHLAASNTTLLIALWSALLGGLILNLMPCVFPVLSIKALSLVKIAEKEPALARMHGLAYTAGVVLSFLIVAGALIALQAGGAQIGWGFQLQNPAIVGALAYLLFLVGLNLIGAFEVSPRFAGIGNRLTQGQNINSSFFTGILATLVATPCTAPFMGAAIGFALVQPAYIGLIVFAALGFGLALPYLALSFMPALQKILPKPGAWMDRFKEFLAFPMFASCIWLVWVVSRQTGDAGVLTLLAGFTLIGFTVWLIRHLPHQGRRRHVAQILIIIASIAVIALLPSATSHKQHSIGAPSQITGTEKFGEVFSEEQLEYYLQADDPVFVEMTAAWCITCKYNHAVAINTKATKALFAQNNVRFMIGDWTNQDPAITKYLKKFGRNGVPLYVYYGPRQDNGERPEPVLLPQILTPGIIKSHF